MPLRMYRFRWVPGGAYGSQCATTRVVRAEDAKDAVFMFENERRHDGVPRDYTVAAVAPDACPTCLGFPFEQEQAAKKCWQCQGTGVAPKRDDEPTEVR